MADDIDDDTVLSALLPIDRTVVSAGGMRPNEQTIVSDDEQLDEKTRAVERRPLRSMSDASEGARVAFAPEHRERYPVRTDGTELPAVTRLDISAPPTRQAAPAPRVRNRRGVIVAVVVATVGVAAVVASILVLVFGP